MKRFKIVVFGELSIATKVVSWVREQEELELIGCVLHNPNAHNNAPWTEIPVLGEYCKINDIKLYTISELKDNFQNGELDLGLACRFGKIFKKEMIDLFRVGIINMHGGLLPEFAGLYSCNHSIMYGDGKGGGTLHWIDEGIDTGDIIRRCEFDIAPTDNAYDVFQKTQVALYENMIEVIMPILHGEFTGFQNQEELKKLGYAHRYFKAGSLEEYKQVDISMEPDELLKIVRACDFPGHEPAYFVANGQKIYLRMDYR